ncbi:MAG: hypothetical protein WC877_00440 [Dehalococcoidales bacterium]|jgi:hypothetical protein
MSEDVYTDIKKEVSLRDFLKLTSEYISLYRPQDIYFHVPMEIQNNGYTDHINQIGHEITLFKHIREQFKDKVIHSMIQTTISNINFSLYNYGNEKHMLMDIVKKDKELRFKCSNPDMIKLLLENKKDDYILNIQYYPQNNSEMIEKSGLRQEYIEYTLQKPLKNGFKDIYQVYDHKVFKSNVQRDILIVPINSAYTLWDKSSDEILKETS